MKTSQIVLTSLSVLGVAGIGYAIYFDHKRQTDPAFRKSLKKDNKKTVKASKREAAKRAKEEDKFIEELLAEVRSPGTFPAGVEEREQYFLKYVSLGEQLFAMGADKYLEASAAFFKALKVYPQPVELIMIYQKAVPKEVFDTIMRIVSKDIATGGGAEGEGAAGNLDEVDEQAPSASLLEAKAAENDEENDEEDDEDEAESSAAADTSASKTDDASAVTQQRGGTDSGTTSSQEWDTLSATSLNDTGVIVTPNQASSNAGDAAPTSAAAFESPEVKLANIDTSAAAAVTHSDKPTTPSKLNYASNWSPAPVFGGAASPSKEK
ncbi:MAS20-domain-containing protein, partial [Testicularia cyperi]